MRTDWLLMQIDDAIAVRVSLVRVSLQFDPDTAREIIGALSGIEAAQPGRQFIYRVVTQSHSADVGSAEHAGLLRAHGADSVTIGTATGDVEIGWYEITSIAVAPD